MANGFQCQRGESQIEVLMRLPSVYVLVFVMFGSACSDSVGSCTLLGCEDAIEVRFRGFPSQFTARYTGPGIDTTADVKCVDEAHCYARLHRYDGHPRELTVQASWADTTVTRRFYPIQYTLWYPNGEACDDKGCFEATVIFER